MHKARAFFFVCAGLFLLALAYHLGARSAGAQAPGNPVVAASAAAGGLIVAVTSNGDVYANEGSIPTPFRYTGNIFGSNPTPAQGTTIGQLKARYAK